jgi:hypothetical protein
MGIFDIFKNKKTNPKYQPERPEVPKEPKVKKTEKELANESGEPYVAILSMDINPENLHEGAFELDWNDKFIANLIRAGYQMKPDDTDAELVDRWFQNVCRNVVLETWEQEQANNPTRWVKSKDIGNGRREVS